MEFENRQGKYFLGQKVNNAEGLRIFTHKEYKMAKNFGMKPLFANEQFYDGLPVYFASILWDYTTLGVVNGTIYKIAIQIINKNINCSVLIDELVKVINKEFGYYTRNSKSVIGKKYIWDMEKINVFLTCRNLSFVKAINLIITSNKISEDFRNNL